jgi:DnaJ-domain-containing protein 1
MDRAAYLLSFHNFDVLNEGETFTEPALMNEMFELQEKVEDLEDEASTDHMLRDVEGLIDVVSSTIQPQVDLQDFHAAGKAVVRLKYLSKVLKDLQTIKEKYQEDS